MSELSVEYVDAVAAVAGVLRQNDMTGDIEALALQVMTALGTASPPGETASLRQRIRDTYAQDGLMAAIHHYRLAVNATGANPTFREARARVIQLRESS